MPNRFITTAKMLKHTVAITALAARAPQKPSRDTRNGKTRNIGNVGKTYQKVYHAWLPIFSAG